MKAEIFKSTARGSLSLPSSKSVAHRMLISAALCPEESTLHGITLCDDLSATIDCLRALGVRITVTDECIKVMGCDMKATAPTNTLNCRDSASTLRFMIPSAALSGAKVTFGGAERRMERPLSVYEELFDERNLLISKLDRLLFVDGPLPGGEYKVKGNISSQFISGLCFALPLTETDSKISIITPFESKPYVILTAYILKKFGIKCGFTSENTITIRGNQSYRPVCLTAEGDYSSAAFIDALNLIGSNIKIKGLSKNSLQADRVYKQYFDMLLSGTPKIDLADSPDLGPILFTLAAMHNGAKFTNTARLGIKESDRSRAMATELKKFGADIRIYKNSVIIKKAELKSPTRPLCGHKDHRVVMSLAVISTKYGGVIEGAEAVKKSYPNFFDDISRLGIKLELKDE